MPTKFYKTGWLGKEENKQKKLILQIFVLKISLHHNVQLKFCLNVNKKEPVFFLWLSDRFLILMGQKTARYNVTFPHKKCVS